MSVSPSPFTQLALNASLAGPIARQFSVRPSLRDIALQIIEGQWRERQIAGPLPAGLSLYRRTAAQGYRVDSLSDVLIERYCLQSSINLSPDLDFLSPLRGAEFPQAVKVDLHAVETLLNECGPWLLDEYKRALVAFWCEGRGTSPSPWQWLSDHLQAQCIDAAALQLKLGTLDNLESVTARVIALHPQASQRAAFANLAHVGVWLLNLDMTASQWLEPELASAVLIQRPLPEQQRDLLLVFTLAGRLHRFSSRQDLAQALAQSWERGSSEPFHLNLYKTDQSIFEVQARLLLEQQLVLIETIARAPQPPGANSVARLVARVDEATALIEVGAENARQTQMLYQSQLPDWLRTASQADQHAYGNALIRLAQVQQQSAGKSFMYDLPEIIDYAAQAAREAILADHPEATALKVQDIEIVNVQVSAASMGSGGSFVPAGTRKTVRMSLAQFALANLSALRAGTTAVQLLDDAPLPNWLTVDYLRELVGRLDVGKAYPALLQRCLLDDTQASTERQQLFVDQLRVQLPLLALEQYLRKANGVSAQGVSLVNALCDPDKGRAQPVRLYPLGFMRRKGALADEVRNAYLIEGPTSGQGPCVLYRPLLRDPLREFTSRHAFFEALCDAGELQDDILARLDDKARPIYAKGGFEQPHVVRYFPGAEFAPFEIPPPAQIDQRLVGAPVLEHVYRASAKEMVALANEQSVSDDENRWIGYQELGWLMFNTLLPFLSGQVAIAAWMVQLFAELKQELEDDQTADQGKQLVSLLFNTALLVFSLEVETSAFKLQRPKPGIPAGRPVDQVLRAPGVQALSSPSGAPLANLDYSWSAAGLRPSTAQRVLIDRFKTPVDRSKLGSAVPHGRWQGLFVHEERWLAEIEAAFYEVVPGEEGAQVVDEQGREGPWLYQKSPGQWDFDLKLRLRAGMPLNSRVQRMREANRQRVSRLETEQADLLAQRLAGSLQLAEDLKRIASTEVPRPENVQLYASNLRVQYERLSLADAGLKTLNELQTVSNFANRHLRNQFEMASNRIQLLYALRNQFLDSKASVRKIRTLKGQDQLREIVEQPDSARYQRLMTEFRHSKAIVDEVIASHEQIIAARREIKLQLRLGEVMVTKLETLMGEEPAYLSWKSTEIGMQGALILDAERGAGGDLLYDTVVSARLALQGQAELEKPARFTHEKRIEILDGSARKFAMAREGLRNYQASGRTAAAQPLLAAYEETLRALQSSAENQLADLIRVQPEEVEESVPQPSHAPILIKTRNRGVVVGHRRAAEGGRAETVVVIDPIESDELARFEESAEPGVWQAISPQAAQTSAPRPMLSSLLKRSGKLLAEADRQVQRARVQARTASIAVEMQEILALQARPLESLAQQIEASLTVDNAVDSAVNGSDAAVQAKALSDKALELYEEGRQLRIAILKRQPPSASRVAYLKAQGEVRIARPKGREATAKVKGRAQDYLQEYVISDLAGKPLWYAHFHYASQEAPLADFTAAHLKTREQRFERGHYQLSNEQDNQKVIQVYRSRIDKASAEQMFFNV